jgi:hypothetical protein
MGVIGADVFFDCRSVPSQLIRKVGPAGKSNAAVPLWMGARADSCGRERRWSREAAQVSPCSVPHSVAIRLALLKRKRRRLPDAIADGPHLGQQPGGPSE